MIFVAAAVILVSAVNRFLHPRRSRASASAWPSRPSPRSSTARSAVVLLRAGRAHRSVTLTADGKHLLTDVWTSVGRHRRRAPRGPDRLASGSTRSSPRSSASTSSSPATGSSRSPSTALLDAALPEEDLVRLTAVLDRLRTRGRRLRRPAHAGVRPAPVRRADVLVPGSWTVERAPRRGRRGRGGDRRGPRWDRRCRPTSSRRYAAPRARPATSMPRNVRPARRTGELAGHEPA